MERADVLRRKARSLQAQWRETLRTRGVAAGVVLVSRKSGQAVRRVAVYLSEVAVDRRHGIRTAGIVRNELTLRQRARHGDSQYYQAISRRGFREVMAAADADPTATSFVDLGAGRGRALVFAAEHGFPDVLGVELDPELAARARSNAAAWLTRRRRRGRSVPNIVVQVGDAAEADVPSGPVLLFVYNSFGEETLRTVVKRLLASYDASPRRIILCYFNPVHANVVDAEERLVVTERSPYWLVCEVRR